MQLLSTAVITGLETIGILTIFLKWSESMLARKFHFHCHCLDLPIFPDQPTVQHRRDTNQLSERFTKILSCSHDILWEYFSWLKFQNFRSLDYWKAHPRINIWSKDVLKHFCFWLFWSFVFRETICGVVFCCCCCLFRGELDFSK